MWGMIFLAPIFSELAQAQLEHGRPFSWQSVVSVWLPSVNYLIVFTFHNYFIAPIAVHERKIKTYFLLALALIMAVEVLSYFLRPPLPPSPPHPAPFEASPYALPPFKRQDIVSFALLTLGFGMNVGVKQYFKSEDELRQLALREKEHLAQELNYLKYQVNPHFFMNTLNNIHALVDINPAEAKQSIVVLSKMMRYLLYEGSKPLIPLQHELDFLQNYIKLMRMRFDEKQVQITTHFEVAHPGRQLPPLLFVMYVENAFKHGVSYHTRSRVDVSFVATDAQVTFTCSNTIAPRAAATHPAGGVGLENARKRLALICGERCQLHTGVEGDVYRVELTIPLDFDETPPQTTRT